MFSFTLEGEEEEGGKIVWFMTSPCYQEIRYVCALVANTFLQF